LRRRRIEGKLIGVQSGAWHPSGFKYTPPSGHAGIDANWKKELSSASSSNPAAVPNSAAIITTQALMAWNA
jgi:hypothetical protein